MFTGYALMTRLRLPAMSAVLAIMCLQSPAAGALAVLRVGQPAEDPAYRLGTSTVVRGFVENQGPDRSVDGELYVHVSRPADVVGGGGLCPKDPGYATQAHCHLDHLSPGERMSVLVRVKIEPTIPNWDYESLAVTFRAFSQTPYRNGINESQIRIVFCHSKKSSLAGCKNAK